MTNLVLVRGFTPSSNRYDKRALEWARSRHLAEWVQPTSRRLTCAMHSSTQLSLMGTLLPEVTAPHHHHHHHHPPTHPMRDEGKVPEDWNQQKVHPILKKGSHGDPVIYRPITHTSISCPSTLATLQHIISSNINDHLERQPWLARFQHGFRTFCSRECQLLITTTDIFNTMENQRLSSPWRQQGLR